MGGILVHQQMIGINVISSKCSESSGHLDHFVYVLMYGQKVVSKYDIAYSQFLNFTISEPILSIVQVIGKLAPRLILKYLYYWKGLFEARFILHYDNRRNSPETKTVIFPPVSRLPSAM
jgi:hypothetical protein